MVTTFFLYHLCAVEPNFYSKNLLFLGKTYMKLNNRKMALLWLSKAKERVAHTEEDKQVNNPVVVTAVQQKWNIYLFFPGF